MLYTQDREKLRKQYSESWQKLQNKQPLSDLDRQIVMVIADHPEYRHIIENPDAASLKDFFVALGEVNPYLHMSLHLGLREQVITNRPQGIKPIFDELLKQKHDQHQTEHAMMEVLAKVMWEAQRNQQQPSDMTYLTELQALLYNDGGSDPLLRIAKLG